MRLVILCIGTFGDVYPYAALAASLKTAGYEISFATHSSYREFITGKGLEYVSIAGDPDNWLNEGKLLSLIEASSDFVHWITKLKQMAAEILEDIFNSCLLACQRADAIIYSPLAWIGYSIAEKMGIKSIAACLQPLSPTGSFPSVWLGECRSLGKPGNLWTHIFIQSIYWHFNRPVINRWRRSSLGLEQINLQGPYRTKLWKSQLFLYGFSRYLIPRPPDWPESHHVTGWWFFEKEQEYIPPLEVQEFLLSGKSPVCIGFGSMPDIDSGKLLEIIVKALEITGQRGIIQLGKNTVKPDMITPRIIRTGWIDHEWLFPQMAAVVHHASASSTAQSIRSGVPTVTVPYAWDQPYWGRQIAVACAGPKPVHRKRLTAEKLASAIQTALHSTSIKERCSKLSFLVNDEKGTLHALNYIKSYLDS